MEFPDAQGYSVTNLQYMKRFYFLYSQSNTKLVLDCERLKQNQDCVVLEGTQDIHLEISVSEQNEGNWSTLGRVLGTIPWRHHVETLFEKTIFIQPLMLN